MAVDTPSDGQLPSYQSSSGKFEWVDDSAGSPGGSNNQIQYNNSGAFGGDAGFVMVNKGGGNSTTIKIGQIKIGNSDIENETDAGELEITTKGTGGTSFKNSTTNSNSTVFIRGNGTGTPILNLLNETKSITLRCNTNQKLTVEGGANTFIFDASSGTGGITFPDGTTQTTAASGGGGGMPLLSFSTTLNTSQKTHFVSAFPPFTRSVLTASSQNITNKPTFFPFVLPKDLTFASVAISINTNASGDDLDIAIYNADSTTGNPTTKVTGSEVTSATTPAGNTVTNFSSDLSLDGGTVYWVGMVKNSADASFSLRSHSSFGDGIPQSPITNMANYNQARIVKTTTSSSLPASFTGSDYENAYGLIPFFGLVEA